MRSDCGWTSNTSGTAGDGSADGVFSQLFGNSAAEPGEGWRAYLSPYYLYAVPALLLPWAVLLPFGLFVTWERNRPDLRRGRMPQVADLSLDKCMLQDVLSRKL